MTDARKLHAALAVVVLLGLLVAAMAYKFIVAGSTAESKDGRVVILLEPAERAFVLGEMRAFLSGVQRLSEALASEDHARVAKLARELGSDPESGVAVALMGKLPLEFKTLGLAVHADFNRMAKEAEAKAAPRDLLRQLGTTLQKCVACHEHYQFAAPPAKQPAPGAASAGPGTAGLLARK